MMRFLVPCDGSAHARRALQHLIRLAQCLVAPEILLLNVRESADAWEVRSFLSPAEIADLQQSEGEADLCDARDLLAQAGIAYTAHVVCGPIPETIADFAAQHGCDQIVMGTHGRGGLATLFLGSVAAAVVRLSGLPVTLIK
jgi:nucleotide-binding universal stress UspA family protein